MRQYLLAVAIGSVLLAGSSVASAESLVVPQPQMSPANDAGLPATGGGISLSGLPAAVEGFVCPNGVFNETFTGLNVQSGRIFRDGVASVCPGKAYPGVFNVGTNYNFETFTFPNTSNAAACVTVNFDPNAGATPCGTNAHASAYIGSYDPLNQGTNFVGDVGSSTTQPFSFEVPASSNLVLAVTNTAGTAICDFSFEVVNFPCTNVPLAPPLPVAVNDQRALLLLAALTLLVGGVVATRMRA